jgi:hypothetical protein
MCGQKAGLFNAYKSGSYSNHLVFMVTVKYLLIQRPDDEAAFGSSRFARHAKQL